MKFFCVERHTQKRTWEIGNTCTVLIYTYMHMRIQLLRSLSPCIFRSCDKYSGVPFVMMNHGYSERRSIMYMESASAAFGTCMHVCDWTSQQNQAFDDAAYIALQAWSMQLHCIDKVNRFNLWGAVIRGISKGGKTKPSPRGLNSIISSLRILLYFQMSLIRCVVQNHPPNGGPVICMHL